MGGFGWLRVGREGAEGWTGGRVGGVVPGAAGEETCVWWMDGWVDVVERYGGVGCERVAIGGRVGIGRWLGGGGGFSTCGFVLLLQWKD